mmetsp:Transcript_36045/g.41026  ORF Transcript_36045/g.41026 Transcript_36045/m.41026 type:complete len:81 (-) Transcript_36045:1499-1741(-)
MAGVGKDDHKTTTEVKVKHNGPRADALGNVIVKGSKVHRITFRDERGDKPIFDVKVVESYKEYNKFDYYSNPNSKCCTIF